jgi:Fe-S oxidoreductase
LGGGENAPAALRLNAARAKDADILAVACPVCLTMLEDALETSGGGLNVFDVSELVLMGI